MSGAQVTAVQGQQFLSGAAGSASVARAAEVAAFDAARNLVFVSGPQGVDALDATTLAFRFGLPASSLATAATTAGVTLGGANGVAVQGSVLAVAYDGAARGQNGAVAFYDLSTVVLGEGSATPPALTRIVTGADFATPDQIVFTPDGSRLLVAIEGEPTDNYAADPRGGVAIITVATGAVQFAGFEAFDASAAALRAAGVFMNGRANATAAANTSLPSRDLEPEYITINAAGTKAYVALQEANAIAILDIASATIEAVLPLGLKNHNVLGNGIDPTDTGGVARIGTWPIFGAYMPDAIASFEAGGRTFLVTANEGDAREWGNFVDPIRISGIADSQFDPVAFPEALRTALKTNAQAGRLDVNRFLGDTDGDGDYDRLIAYGGRSFSIWEVTGSGASAQIRQVWDSGQTIDTFIATSFPARYDDGRSDNKGAEPEHVVLAEIDGALHALVGLERANMVMGFRIDTSQVASGGDPRAQLVGAFGAPATTPADVAPEAFTYIPGTGGAPGRIVVPFEGSGNQANSTLRALDLSVPSTFTLQILHGSDFEGGLLAPQRAPNFAAIVDVLEDTHFNSITLSSGDNFIPGPFLAAGGDAAVRPALRAFYEQMFGVTGLTGLREGAARVDVAILNAIGIQASALGNHEFDLGPNVLADALDFVATLPTLPAQPSLASISSIGAQFPYLSANLNFSGESVLNNLFTGELRDWERFVTRAADLASGAAIRAEATGREIAPWTTITVGGETIGILGATTQVLRSISSPGNVQIAGGEGNNMAALAAVLQPFVDQMTAQGINKIILLSHLQQNAFELDLATRLSGVDVIVAGGSHQVWADGQDMLRAGDTAGQAYPQFRTGADGRPVAIVNTGAEYSYVGRLVVTFDADGVLIADPDGDGARGIGGVDATVSGAFATDEAGLGRVIGDRDGTVSTTEGATAFADGTRGGEVKQLADAVQSVIGAKDGNVAGFTDVFLDGRRGEVRTEETNLGNLTADANLWLARQTDPTVLISLKNGGGIRAEIGAIVGQPVPAEVPPIANPATNKPAGAVSQLDIENSLRFNNGLSIVTFTAENLVKVLENALRGVAPGATPGGFPQVSGLQFSFDRDRPAGDRVVSLAVVDADGTVLDVLARDGNLVGDAARSFRVVGLNFNFDQDQGGDNWLSPTASPTDPGRASFTNRVNLFTGTDTAYAQVGREQAALASYLSALHGTAGAALNRPDTAPELDTRIQNLDLRADAVLPTATVSGTGGTVSFAPSFVAGPAPGLWTGITTGNRSEVIDGTRARDIISASGGHDTVSGGLGADSIAGGQGLDSLMGDAGNDSLVGGLNADTLDGGAGNDVMEGGLGADVYVVDSAGDVVSEVAGGGPDTVLSRIDTYTLPDSVERLRLLEGARDGIGNIHSNLIEGNAGANRLDGGRGSDTLDGGGGDDLLLGGTGGDRLLGGMGADTLVGGLQADVMTGGGGADVFLFDSVHDSRPDAWDEITDFVRGEDRIRLAFDANAAVAGVQGFSFTSLPFAPLAPGFLRIEAGKDANSVLALANTDRDAEAEFALLVRGVTTLDAADFI